MGLEEDLRYSVTAEKGCESQEPNFAFVVIATRREGFERKFPSSDNTEVSSLFAFVCIISVLPKFWNML
jgi:hypothetical protein